MSGLRRIDWESLDWAALDRLRERFLSAQPGGENYWTSRSDLENYEITFAQRIGWKWDAVLRELRQRGWTPPSNSILDWGCGSGIAGRCFVEAFDPKMFKVLHVFDRSPCAMEYTIERARREFPDLRAEPRIPGESEPPGTLLVSHVLNELDESGGRALRLAIDRADAVLWVEPGTYADSRSLIAMREALQESFHVIAPCTHQSACGMTVPENERHWCHHFARPPAGIMADSNWVRFAQRAGIDLRSLPYSFLVLERKGIRDPVPGLLPDGYSRIIGEPRFYKGYAKVFSCRDSGVGDVTLQKRDRPELFKLLKSTGAAGVQCWRTDCGINPSAA